MNKTLTRLLAAPVLALGLIAVNAGSSLAAVPADETYVGGTANQLRTHAYTYDPATGNYVHSTCSSLKAHREAANGVDSPLDPNSNDFVATVCGGGNDFIEAYTTASLNLNTALVDLTNVGFDYRTADITGAGQVYIALVLSNGEILYLDPTYCSSPLNGTYSTADFTGTTAAGACTVYSSTGASYTSDGTSSALDVYAAAHPGVVVKYDFIGFFNGTASTVTYHVDRVQLGTGYSYDYSKLYAHQCSTEASC